jgi:hypothetical protein
LATANPLKRRLLFERFLSERRTSLPDIDLDVESARRLEVYDQIFERLGRERVAVTGMIVTNGRVTAPAVALAKQQRLYVVDRQTLGVWTSGSRPLGELLRAVPPPRRPSALS